MFVKLFCFLLPFGLLREFDKLNESVDGLMKGNMVWLVIPVSVVISWVYTSLDQVGESTENPFEGTANDVPISQMSRAIEIDLRQFLGETDLPPALQPQNNIVLCDEFRVEGNVNSLPGRMVSTTGGNGSNWSKATIRVRPGVDVTRTIGPRSCGPIMESRDAPLRT
jgi:hypothetical protein